MSEAPTPEKQPTEQAEGERCTCERGDALASDPQPPAVDPDCPLHGAPTPPPQEGERWTILICPDCGEQRNVYGGCICSEEPIPKAQPVEVVPASELTAARKERDEWETAAKETAVLGASNAAWKGEAWESLRTIREITTSDEIEGIVDGLIGPEHPDAAEL